MEEAIYEIRKYLPIYFRNPENEEYVKYLTSAYIKNLESECYQFSFIAFHIFYMTFIYKIIWFLKQNSENHIFEKVLKGCNNGKDLIIYSSIFDASVLSETKAFDFLSLLKYHKNDLDIFSHPVEVRNYCSHASGKLHYNEKEIEENILKEIEYVRRIQIKSESLLKDAFSSFLYENWDPDNRVLGLGKDSVDDFIRKNSISYKDLEFLIYAEIPEFKEKSTNPRIIYIKVLFLVFLLVAREFVDSESDRFTAKLPILMNGFNEQHEMSIEAILNDEFSPFFDNSELENLSRELKVSIQAPI